MIEVQAPKPYIPVPGKTIFLAGSIDMGEAVEWQRQLITELTDTEGLVLNPRRDDWDSFAEQRITDPYFSEQVNWELDGINAADIVLIYFAPDSKAPISLMELGICASHPGKRVVVCCPEGFYRRGNIEIVCARAGILVLDTLEELKLHTRWLLK